MGVKGDMDGGVERVEGGVGIVLSVKGSGGGWGGRNGKVVEK